MTPEERFVQFAKDAVKRQRLEDILNDPVLVEATTIIKELMEPTTGGQADAAPAMAASYFHQFAGAKHFRMKLRSLTREPVERKVLQSKRLAKTLDDLPKDTPT